MSSIRNYDCFLDDSHNDYEPTFQSTNIPLLNSRNYGSNGKQYEAEQPRSSLSFTDPESFSFAFNESSFTSFEKQDSEDHARNLQILEQKLAQQLLSLRQQKLTLMQEYNQIVHNRYKVEREVHKLNKRKQNDKKKVQQDFIPTVHNTKFQKNPNLVSTEQEQKIDYESLTQQECEIMQKVLNLKHANNQLELKLTSMNSTPKKSKNHSQKNIHQLILHLQQKREKLMKLSLQLTPQQNLSNSLCKLWQTNASLHKLMNSYIDRKTEARRKIQQLKQRVKKNEENKKQIIQEVINIKSKVKCLRVQNQEFRRACDLFRFSGWGSGGRLLL